MIKIRKEDSIPFEGENSLFHYTSINTAIEQIFPLGKLRLSPVSSAIDPMEHLDLANFYSASGLREEDYNRINENHDVPNIRKKVNNYYKSLRQLCLSRNSEIDFEGQFGGAFEPIDHFGFAKPRMWDQYGDGYKGVCIALNRSKLIKQLSDEFNVMDILYSKNSSFKPNIDNASIDLNEIDRLGEDEYLRKKFKYELNKLKTKHLDYNSENECKVLVSSKDDYAYIDFRDCIQAIFITNKLNQVYIKWLKNVANDYKVPLFEISIKRTGLQVFRRF